LTAQTEGQIPYLLMAANAAGFCWLETGTQAYADYMRAAFLDYVRYMGVEGGDTYIEPSRRTAASYNSSVYVGTESKIHGWSSRYGQYYLAAEGQILLGLPQIGLSRQTLYFGALGGGVATAAQSVIISNAGGGTLSWAAASSQSWLGVTPASGTGAGTIAVSVNTAGLAAGSYTGTITVSDPSASNTPQTIAVTLTVIAAGASVAPFGSFDTPSNNATGITGAIPVTGWVVDDVEVIKVEILRDNVAGEAVGQWMIGTAVFVEGARPDIEIALPGYPLNYKAGWGYMMLTNMLPGQGNGPFTLYAYATDKEGHTVLLGTKTITCDNAHATTPFGTIDSPAQGGTASGSDYRNWGWALTPQTKIIPVDGSTISVWVDSVNKGTLTGTNLYNLYRPDVSGAFPGLKNTGAEGDGGPVGVFFLDTTAYTDGVHTIAWLVTDDQGAADGIGSRYFTILNAGAGAVADTAGDIYRQESMSSRGAKRRGDLIDQTWRYEDPDEILNLPMSFAPLSVKRGFSLAKPAEVVVPDNYGAYHIEIKEVELLTISLDPESADFNNPPTPPFRKGGEDGMDNPPSPPFRKGGEKGTFVSLRMTE